MVWSEVERVQLHARYVAIKPVLSLGCTHANLWAEILPWCPWTNPQGGVAVAKESRGLLVDVQRSLTPVPSLWLAQVRLEWDSEIWV